MAIVVEDGTGLANADAALSVAEADAYHAQQGSSTWAAHTTQEKESAIIKATSYGIVVYDGWWRGQPKTTTQSLPWPRLYAFNNDGIEISSSSLPRGYKYFTAEIAGKIIEGEVVLPDETDASSLAEYSIKVGPIEESTKYNQQARFKRYTTAELWLTGLLIASNKVRRG